MHKTPGWQNRLVAYLAAAGRERFVPGQHDCALFASGALAAMTGVDLAAPYRGRYTTERGGIRILRKDGYHDHVALAAAHLRTRADGERARPGDLAVIPTETGPALGVVQGAAVYVLTPDRLALVPLAQAVTVLEVR
ncbi:hypothetical protein JI664_03490 [Rhodobacter sp. NTK016B]|uniref:DUF6950 family protein n=1 Tax=Rhodobacter sp. NTK016B TaxID=2759676 RepID=UPI001A8C6B0F|nr:hypothetical protein [Rhodobacter sp. NTK016B]MBN8291020.1 hypothetical protein [Rhodobacter sp. NTK016B]